jgi:hypothetical protein
MDEPTKETILRTLRLRLEWIAPRHLQAAQNLQHVEADYLKTIEVLNTIKREQREVAEAISTLSGESIDDILKVKE